jgi:hypothetical protein
VTIGIVRRRTSPRDIVALSRRAILAEFRKYRSGNREEHVSVSLSCSEAFPVSRTVTLLIYFDEYFHVVVPARNSLRLSVDRSAARCVKSTSGTMSKSAWTYICAKMSEQFPALYAFVKTIALECVSWKTYMVHK